MIVRLLCSLIISTGLMALPMHYTSTTNISIGETFQYMVKLPVSFSEDIQPSFGVLSIIKKGVNHTAEATIITYDLQTFSIEPPIIATLSIIENGYPPIELPPIYIQLLSTLSPTKNTFNDIAPIYSITHINWMLVLIIVATVLVSLFVYYSWKTWRKKKHASSMTPVKDPPIKTALHRLKQLSTGLNNDDESIKKAYFILTEIFCTFLTDELFVDALDATTSEMRRLLKSCKRLNDKQVKDIMRIAEEIDHYKFSKRPTFDLDKLKGIIQNVSVIIKEISNGR